ncbi:hypothetical protein L596_022417 [Steinernema carpocapsae]|uniref:Peptidase C14 caspase domain-containing protein n=1 Tax=Steinernema carpocapsae TaxID=34508 RepID=A0A4U5MMI5_STECR|nr:hypothetical protein L596_022417 [Steinernema carpocapsae]
MRAEIKMFCDRLGKRRSPFGLLIIKAHGDERGIAAPKEPGTFEVISLREIMETVTGTKPIIIFFSSCRGQKIHKVGATRGRPQNVKAHVAEEMVVKQRKHDTPLIVFASAQKGYLASNDRHIGCPMLHTIAKELENANLKSPARYGVRLTELLKETLQKRYNGRVSPCKAYDRETNSAVDQILQSDIVESHFDHEILL